MRYVQSMHWQRLKTAKADLFIAVSLPCLSDCCHRVMQDASEQKEQELAAMKQKLSALESDSQKRICDLENQLKDASATATATAGTSFMLWWSDVLLS